MHHLLSKTGSMAVDDSPSKKSHFIHTYIYYIQGGKTLNKARSSYYGVLTIMGLFFSVFTKTGPLS